MIISLAILQQIHIKHLTIDASTTTLSPRLYFDGFLWFPQAMDM
jgi:hypothetical protein